MQGTASVRYNAVDGPGVAGKLYPAAAGKVTFLLHEIVKSIPISFNEASLNF